MRRYDLDGIFTTTFAVDDERRTMRGLVVPWDRVGEHGNGDRWKFARGSLKFVAAKFVRMFEEHSPQHKFGRAIEAEETEDGLYMTFKIDEGPHGDRMLREAKTGRRIGLSPGVEADEADITTEPDGTRVFGFAHLIEVSQVRAPAFTDSRLISVTASREGGSTMPDEPEHQAPIAPATPETNAGHVAAQFAAFQTWQAQQNERPSVVNPIKPTVQTQVKDPQSYRFDSRGELHNGAHDFGLDIIRAIRAGDEYGQNTAEGRRVMEFLRAQFTVETGDVNELNPTINLPRYIDQREYRYPVWSAVNRGAPPNGVQPFSWPKFNSASGLVAAHTEGVEPTSGNYTTTLQTVTPTAVSGKASISRETWDMGGLPGIGNLLWQQMQRGWFEALEARVVAVLDAATPTALGTFTAGGGTTGQTLAAEMRDALARLHFIRGGFRFDTAFAQVDLYTELAGALDDAGRPLFPAIGPSNADGTVETRYQSINVNGVPFIPTWALAATGTVAASSYLLDRLAVDGWATSPQRLEFAGTASDGSYAPVAMVDLAIWGYGAAAINDLNGVREISYDPAP